MEKNLLFSILQCFGQGYQSKKVIPVISFEPNVKSARINVIGSFWRTISRKLYHIKFQGG